MQARLDANYRAAAAETWHATARLRKPERIYKKKRLREGRRQSGDAISGGVNAPDFIRNLLNISRHGLVITLIKDAWEDFERVCLVAQGGWTMKKK
jgi:hypothetical protein